jgi:glucose-1-phosphate thymidylyltransferase
MTMSSDTAVVLAAGEGTRLRPLTKYRPKPMLPAANRPILEHVLDALIETGFTDLQIVVGYGRDRVQNHFGPSYRGVPVHYHVQDKQLGTGHALLQVRDDVDGEFLVVNGDEIVTPATVEAVIDAHDRDCDATLAVVESTDAPEYGAVKLSGDRVTEFVEKPGTDDYRFLNIGVYAFDDDIFGAIAATKRRDGELSLADPLIEWSADETRVIRGVETAAAWRTVDYPWDLLSVSAHLLAEGALEEPEVKPRTYVADSAHVHGDATLHPPVVISEDCEVGPGAVVGPNVALGRNATVGANATVRESVLDTDARIDPGATLLDCVAGLDVHLGPDVTVPGGPAEVRVGDRIHGNRRLGAVLAARATVGGGATVVPGTLVGPDARVAAGTVADGVIPEGAEVVR